METGVFCFITDEYYIDFPDDKLMKNKEIISGKAHNRPCFFAFQENANKAIYWLIPISSKYEKYKNLFDGKVEKYGFCNTIRLGDVLGTKAAFLIQNMFPVSSKYIAEVYLDKNSQEVHIDTRLEQEIVENAKTVLAKVKRGAKIVFPDILKIYKELEIQLKSAHLLDLK